MFVTLYLLTDRSLPDGIIVYPNLNSTHAPRRRVGPLMGGGGGGAQCRLSILRNGNVPCCYFLNVAVDFKIV